MKRVVPQDLKLSITWVTMCVVLYPCSLSLLVTWQSWICSEWLEQAQCFLYQLAKNIPQLHSFVVLANQWLQLYIDSQHMHNCCIHKCTQKLLTLILQSYHILSDWICISIIWHVVYMGMSFFRVVTIVFSLIFVAIGISVIAETYHDILYAK